MTLDAQAKGLLDSLAAQGMKGFEEMTVAESRETVYAFIELQGDPEPVARVTDETVPVEGGEIAVRIYHPAGVGPHPVLLYFHGGGFVFGDLAVIDRVCRSWCNAAQVAVIAVCYRKAPEHPYPAAAEDAYAALCWAVQHADELDLDSTRVVTCGDSAGGNLATVVAMMARDRSGPAIAYQLLIYPMVDARGKYASRTENGQGYLLSSADIDWFYGHYLSQPSDADEPYASPIRGSLAGLPPATVITAGFDPLRDEGDAYATALEEAGVPVLHVRNPTMIHGFMWLMGVIRHTRGVYDTLGLHLRRVLATG